MISHLKNTVNLQGIVTYLFIQHKEQLKSQSKLRLFIRMSRFKMTGWFQEPNFIWFLRSKGFRDNQSFFNNYYNGCHKVFYRVISWITNCRRLVKRSQFYSFIFKWGQASFNKFSLLRSCCMTDQELNGHL